MKAEIPEFIVKMGDEFRQLEDKYGLINPVFTVFYYEYVPVPYEYSDGSFYFYSPEHEIFVDYNCDMTEKEEKNAEEDIKETMEEYYPDWYKEYDIANKDIHTIKREFMPDGLEVYETRKTKVDLFTCLTKEDVENFIARNSHYYKSMDYYVDALPKHSQLAGIREWIKSLTEGK